mgnify:CR=1 FL=1
MFTLTCASEASAKKLLNLLARATFCIFKKRLKRLAERSFAVFFEWSGCACISAQWLTFSPHIFSQNLGTFEKLLLEHKTQARQRDLRICDQIGKIGKTQIPPKWIGNGPAKALGTPTRGNRVCARVWTPIWPECESKTRLAIEQKPSYCRAMDSPFLSNFN